MKTIFIYNASSGKGKIIKYLDYINEELKKKYDVVDIYQSESKEDFIKIIKGSIDNYDTIIFGGGDGTFNLVANAIGDKKISSVLGYIPLGTCNDIARNNKIPLNIKKAIKCILNGKEKYIDVSRINNEYFLYVAAIGTGSACTYVAKQNIKKKLGRLGYLGPIIKEFFKKKIVHARVATSDNIIEGDYALIYLLNTREVGSFVFNRRAKLNSGELEIVLIKKKKGSGRINIARFMIGRMLGIKKLPIESVYSNKFKVEVEGYWNIDGEKGPSGSIDVEVIHNHLKIYAK